MAKTPGRYSLAHHPEAQKRAYWLIRDYTNIKKRLEVLDGYSGGHDGPAASGSKESITERTAAKRAELSKHTDIVDKAIEQLPEEYRKGVWDNMVSKKPLPDTAGPKTWKRYKQQFVWYVAWYAGYLGWINK